MYFKTKSQNEKWPESMQSSQTWRLCSSAGSRDWLLCYISWDGAVPVLGDGGTDCCSLLRHLSQVLPRYLQYLFPSAVFPPIKQQSGSKSTAGCYGVARRALGPDRRWPALPTAQSWTCCSPLGAAACSWAQHWHSAAVWPWGWVVGKQLSCESCLRHSCKKSHTGFLCTDPGAACELWVAELLFRYAPVLHTLGWCPADLSAWL